MASCAAEGGCPSDYIAVALSVLSFTSIAIRASLPYLIHRNIFPRGGGFWVPSIQILASFILLLSILMSGNYLGFKKRYWVQSCYLWAVWGEGPFGFGLLLGCRIVEAFKLYCFFVVRRLPPFEWYIVLGLVLIPWVASATLIHVQMPLNPRCHMEMHWVVFTVLLHILYIISLVGFTWVVRRIEFQFNETKELWRGIVVSAMCVGTWVVAYILNETHEEILWLQVASRFLLLAGACTLVLALFSLSTSQPLLSHVSLRREGNSMGRALGIPETEVLSPECSSSLADSDAFVSKLLGNKTFRDSFIAFADSCFAGENVRFISEVQERDQIPIDDAIRRIYMARHLIERYIVAGAVMEVNISHRSRNEILTTVNLADPNLFKHSVEEVTQLIKMNLVKDYWSSPFFMKFKEECLTRTNVREVGEALQSDDSC